MKESVNKVSSTLPDFSAKVALKNDVTEKSQGEFKQNFDSALKRNDVSRDKVNQKPSERPEIEKSEPVVAKAKVLKNETSASSVNSSAPLEKTLPKELATQNFDDENGLIAQSYSETAVSYPISRIAKESLDDDTKNALKEQGLWDLPTVVAANPSPQLLAMKEAAAISSESEAPAIPVGKPIAQFMASLENELGVKPDRLVQAFRSLPPGQMQLAPEKTMIQVIKNLKLDPKDQAKVTELYTKMLAQLQMQADPQVQSALMATSGAAMLLPKEGAPTEVAAQGMPASRSKAGASGYAKAEALGTNHSAVPSAKASTTTVVRPEAKVTAFSKTDAKDSAGLGPKAAPGKEAASATEGAKAIPEGMLKTQPTPVALNGEAAVAAPTALEAQAQAQGQQAQVNPQNPAQAGLVTAQMKAQEATPSRAKEMSLGDKKETVASVKPDTSSVLGGMAQPSQDSVSSLAQSPKNDLGLGLGSGAAATEMKKDGDAKHEAIRSIVSNAQMLAVKGGGEMRLTLKPDHMGEIQLKVAMEGNKVNIQMTTDRGEVKKLIEQSVHELRHGLASHNLSMEKLDVTFNQKDMSGFSKGQPDFSQARDFSQNFHQQQNEKRELMDDLSSLRSNTLKSQGVQRAHNSALMNAGKTSGRLNVVA